MYTKEEIKRAANNLVDWYNKNLPKAMVGKFTTQRFYVHNPHLPDLIVINKNFYNKIISSHKNDLLYITKLEISKEAHELIKTAGFASSEPSKHHADVECFIIFKCNHKGFDLEFKIKKNRDGYFLYHLKII
jgi:hypothetical protein